MSDVRPSRMDLLFSGSRFWVIAGSLAWAAVVIWTHDYPTLDRYFRRNVIGGAGAFVMTATDYKSFAAAIVAKLIREITQAPIAKGPSSSEPAAEGRDTALVFEHDTNIPSNVAAQRTPDQIVEAERGIGEWLDEYRK